MKIIFSLITLSLLVGNVFAQENVLDELNPFSADIEDQLKDLDQDYEAETGKSSFAEMSFLKGLLGGCHQRSCKVFIDIDKKSQTAQLYVDGSFQHEWKVSTGTTKYETPNFDRHPNGRIYDAYTSSKYPGGDYNGLGNMPYAIFISGGFAIHGTGKSNWPKLGSKASHGCIRLHPDNAFIFNRLVRKHGIYNTWITIR